MRHFVILLHPQFASFACADSVPDNLLSPHQPLRFRDTVFAKVVRGSGAVHLCTPYEASEQQEERIDEYERKEQLEHRMQREDTGEARIGTDTDVARLQRRSDRHIPIVRCLLDDIGQFCGRWRRRAPSKLC
jgi:hypothetical protein